MNGAQRRVVVWLGVVLPLMVAFHGRADPRSHPIPASQMFTATLVVLVLAVLARFIFRRKRRVPVLPPNQRKVVQRLKGVTWLLLALGGGQVIVGTVSTGFLGSWHPLRISLPLCGAWVGACRHRVHSRRTRAGRAACVAGVILAAAATRPRGADRSFGVTRK